MKIVMAGGTGFIGKSLVAELAGGGNEIVSLTRRRDHAGLPAGPEVRFVTWDGRNAETLTPLVDGAGAVINFAGESVGKGRWTEARKKALVESRLGPTTAIVGAIAAAKRPPKVLVNASAVGYYGDVGEEDVAESRPPGGGFLATLCAGWEAAALKAEGSGVRVVILRLAVVLGGKGSALDLMALPFRMFAGGPIGSGRQWFPWVHVSDVAGVVRFAIGAGALRGPVNVAAPEAVRMKEFSSALGKALGRPSWAPVPGFAVRLLKGEVAGMILGGQRVIPAALAKAGYGFRYPHLGPALADSLGKK